MFECKSVTRRQLSSLHFLDVAGLPALVECGFGRAVKPGDGEIAPARNGGEPVGFLRKMALACEYFMHDDLEMRGR
jgi:hypothetical protein